MTRSSKLSPLRSAFSSYSQRAVKYAEEVISGEVLAGRWVRLAAKRFLDDLEKGANGWRYCFNENAANATCALFELFPHEKGELQGQPVRLGDWQCFIFCNLFGWVDRTTGFRRFREALVMVPRGNGKALALDTPVPTTRGWKTQGTLEVGDEIFDEAGKICHVMAVHPVEDGRPCFRVRFSDGSSIVADAEHEWYVEAKRSGISRNLRKAKRTWRLQNIRTTKEIAETHVYCRRSDGTTEMNYRVPVCEPLDTAETKLPIEPYVLGAWLGDGDSDCARITIGDRDSSETSSRLSLNGHPVRKVGHNFRWTFSDGDRSQAARNKSLGATLRGLGLFEGKHIPREYLRASIKQRLELLRGLMDTDGSCAVNGQCEFTGVNRQLCEDVSELLITLGYKPTTICGRATINGRDCGPKYRVCFYAEQVRNPFSLVRKRERVKKELKLSRGRKIVEVEPVASVPVRCISVDSPRSLYLAGKSMIPTHNSPMAAWFTIKMAFFDGEGGAEVYNAATTEDQAFEVFRPAKAIIEMVPQMESRFGIEVAAKSLYQASSRSRVKPVIGKPKDGKAPHGVTNDEYHEQLDDRLYDSFKRGMNKRRQSLLFNISTAGDTIEGPCYQMQQSVQELLLGDYENDRMFGLIYDVDEDVPWTSREAIIMANPNFGVSIDEESILADQKEAIRNSAKQNGFRCKNQNFWAQRTTAWMNMRSWELCKKPLDEADFEGEACYHGSDLASTLDLSATVKVFVRTGPNGKPIYTVFSKAYLPAKRVFDPSRQHLQKWEKDGFLIATEGSAIDYKRIEDDTVADIERFQIRELCFDQRYAGQYAQQVAARTGVDLAVIPPSADQLSPAMKELEAAVEEGRFEHDGHPVMTWCMANVMARSNQATGNYHMPTKDRPEKKIDLAVALFIAMARARLAQPAEESYGVEWF